MGIAEMEYAVTVKSFRQVFRIVVYISYIKLFEAYRTAIHNDKYNQEGNYKTDNIAKVNARTTHPACQQANCRAQSEQRLGHDKYADKEQIAV